MSTTESNSNYNDLELMSTSELLININKEDQTVPLAVNRSLPQIEILVDQIVNCFNKGGRLFYIGAGTSGRLGVVDASECPPTYGVPHDMVIGIIAGGDIAIRKAVENAEDNTELGWKDLESFNICDKDIVVGIAASGRTPYVIGALEIANKNNIATGCIVCNDTSKVAEVAKYPVEVIVGPEFITGSTRMKSGTAQKLVLNMLTTSSMIKIGKVKGNKMVDMQLSNLKLVDRGTKMVMEQTNLPYEEAKQLLLLHGSVRNGVDYFIKHN